VAFITTAPVVFFAQPEWIGWSTEPLYLSSHSMLTRFRVKGKLQSGEMAIPGDQWPVFLYAGYEYDPEDPWKGLFRSTILVSVSC
jgi:hypothetical protein